MKKPFKLTAPEPSEDEFQQSVADLLDTIFAGYPVVWTHFPAGGYALSKAAAARLYRLGLKRGLPDIMVWWNSIGGIPRCLGIELKTRKGRSSGAQRAMHTRLEDIGVPVMVCRTVDEVLIFLRYHLVPMRKVRLNMEALHGKQGAAGRSSQESAEGARTEAA